LLDEIHRFNKAQQDALLPAVEQGLVTLIGATTENPYFEVNSALLSRTQIYELETLSDDDLAIVVRRGIAELGAEVTEDLIALIARRAGGDARNALNILELASQPACAAGCGRGSTCGRARRTARGAAQPVTGRDLPRPGAEVERELRGDQGSDAGRARARALTAARRAPGRPLLRREEARPGAGLHLPSQ